MECLFSQLDAVERLKTVDLATKVVEAEKLAEEATARLKRGKKAFITASRLRERHIYRLKGEKQALDEALQVAKLELLPVQEDLRVSRRYAQLLLINGIKLERLFEHHTERATMDRLVLLADNEVKVGQTFEEMLRKDLKAQRKIAATLKRQLCDSSDTKTAQFVAEEAKAKAAKSAVTRELVLKAARWGELKNASDNAQFWFEKGRRETEKKEQAMMVAEGWVEIGKKDEVSKTDEEGEVSGPECEKHTEAVQTEKEGEMSHVEGETVEAEGAMMAEEGEMADDEMTGDECEVAGCRCRRFEVEEAGEAEEDDAKKVEDEDADLADDDGEMIEMNELDAYSS
ncbi:hypothetical protein LTR17_027285 [Elasticomyces elasticus]|nr:hypothetical protein LTR17_027285 [Elasticomyces elasticus]